MGKVIVITGASAGIGAALARHLAAQGHSLALAARRSEPLEKVLVDCGDRAVALPTDVTRRDEVTRLCKQAIEEFGRIDVWVNNVGRGINREVLDLTDEEFDEMFLVNVKSALYGMQVTIPHFKARSRGHIINVSSVLSRAPSATFRSAYSAAKAALNILTASLRMDLQRLYPEIYVSLVLPGPVTTDFQTNSLGGTPAMTSRNLTEAQTAEEVAEVIRRVIDNPTSEVYTSQAIKDIACRYCEDVAEFERSMVSSQ